jgi:biopolymer transport protein ExbB/TolQ
MQRFLSLGTDCVKIPETTDASKGFSFCPSFLLVLFYLFVLMLLMAADIFSFVTVALATVLARIATLEAELKTSMEALKDANTAKVSAEKATKSAETRAKKAEKALADASQKQTKREQSVVERLDKISTSVGSKCFILPLDIC